MRAIILFTPGYYAGLGFLYALIGLLAVLVATVLLVALPLWGPVWLATHNRSWHRRGARRLSVWLQAKWAGANNWMATGGQWVLLGLGAILLVTMFALLTAKTWWLGLAWYGGAIGIAVAACLFFWGLIEFADWSIPRAEEKRRRKQEERRPPKPPPEPSWLSLVWAFVKAKKRRVCPLIEVNKRRTTT